MSDAIYAVTLASDEGVREVAVEACDGLAASMVAAQEHLGAAPLGVRLVCPFTGGEGD